MSLVKKVTIDGKEYYMRRNPRGYGWDIMERTPVSDERATYRCLFNSLNDALVQRYFDQFESGNIVTNFPDTSHETYPEKILIHRTKHFTAHYSVPTLEILEKTYRYVLTQEYSDSIQHMKPENMIHNDSGVTSPEEIESIPVEKVREEVRLKWNKYMKEIKENAKYTKEWMNLKMVVEGGGHAFSAMEAFEYDNYELENIITIS